MNRPNRRTSQARGNRRLLLAGVLSVLLTAAPARAEELRDGVLDLVSRYENRTNARVGVSIVQVDTGAPVVGYRDGELMIPASNQKLLTSAFVLAKLGSGFRYSTAVYLVEGNLLIVGDGDPTLGDPVLARRQGRTVYDELDRWAEEVVRRIPQGSVGDILLVRARQEVPLRHPHWPASQNNRWYQAPVAELNFHNNCFDVYVDRAAGGGLAGRVEPLSRWIQVDDRRTTGSSHVWSLQAAQEDSQVVLRGTINTASPTPVSVAVDHPSLLLGRVFADRLQRAGVGVTGQIRVVPAPQTAPTRAQLVALTLAPMEHVLERCNRDSLNMTAEAMFLRAGDFTWGGSARIMTSSLERTFQLAPGSVRVADGSGLSRENQCTPAAITQLLTRTLGFRDGWLIVQSLPVSGRPGSLERRLHTGAAQGRVLGKTGTLADVSALSGYILDASGRPAVAYSILVNGIRPGEVWLARELQDAICREIVAALRETD